MSNVISAHLVKELREKTGAGIMECKKALEASGGSIEEAEKWLRQQGMAKAKKKSERQTPEGVIASYIHAGDKIGVLVEVNCETDFVARTPAFKEFVKEIAIQIAAANPKFISKNDVPKAILDSEKNKIISTLKLENDENMDRIIQEKLEKFFIDNCLLEQPFVKDPSITINDLLYQRIAQIGENIVIRRFVRFQVGEELEDLS
ncbi:translation elongation factor Ts [Methylacidiphilum fumariolicum]|uniref:Elongation factor Ts n=2 Tax=Candidatus Methylacidiphilum fumarolicum TaxID=591154 RepID=I0JXA5_METFB|nr:translation elongation factor Ts [Candidatus Methylacidiphilum fumarolicum]MBW6414208.1 translation elongation factor Ts [Candidatus Methylacidiphilum fumarolicum]CAI9086409.1 Elongation factor Ts [Candidatus Methylacidiphilum fumarolicum]CCG91874.1 Elongation factor Ts [Methylacidiphilum fumariolicum SolV]